MIDFPASPSTGQIFNSGTGAIYIWDGVAWSLATSSTRTARSKNLLVNPSMQISQENGNTGVGNGGWPADQWLLATLGFVAVAARTQAFITPDNSMSTLIHSFTALNASPAAGDYCQMLQHIEGLRMAELQWGTAKAIPAVLRFNAACETAGTYTAVIQNAAGDQSWLAAFTCDGTTNLKTYAFPVPARTVGTWNKDNTSGGSVRFIYGIGSTYGGGVAGWQAANKLGIAGQTNGGAVTGKNLIIGDVGLYADPDNTGLPPAFVAPEYADDLLRCMRYWRKQQMRAGANSTGNTYCGLLVPFTEPLRISPTVSYTDLIGTPSKLTIAGQNGYTPAGGNVQASSVEMIADIISPIAVNNTWWAIIGTFNARM